jgi:hypothetical protein
MKKPKWPRVELSLEDGSVVPAVAPLVISASRATDIPAYFSSWVMEQLEKGYCLWINPFNGKPLHISFENARVIVFWSKNPEPLLPFLDKIEEMNINYFFQLTVNDYETEGWEPYIPPLDARIATVRKLSQRIGRKRLLWRYDPLIITDTVSPRMLLEKIEKTGDRIADLVSRLTVSFLSPYRSVMRQLNMKGIRWRETSNDIIEQIGSGLAALSAKWGLEVVTCAETADFNRHGILPGSCIDPLYISSEFKDDNKLMEFMFQNCQEELFSTGSSGSLRKRLKDPGQRELCGCMVSKDIGLYGTCKSGCLYCYARGRGSGTSRGGK